MSVPGSNSPTAKAPDSEPKGVGLKSNLSMSVVAIGLWRGGHLALDTNCGYFRRALSSRDGCRGVLGLFDDAVSPRALLFAPLRLDGASG